MRSSISTSRTSAAHSPMTRLQPFGSRPRGRCKDLADLRATPPRSSHSMSAVRQREKLVHICPHYGIQQPPHDREDLRSMPAIRAAPPPARRLPHPPAGPPRRAPCGARRPARRPSPRRPGSGPPRRREAVPLDPEDDEPGRAAGRARRPSFIASGRPRAWVDGVNSSRRAAAARIPRSGGSSRRGSPKKLTPSMTSACSALPRCSLSSEAGLALLFRDHGHSPRVGERRSRRATSSPAGVVAAKAVADSHQRQHLAPLSRLRRRA